LSKTNAGTSWSNQRLKLNRRSPDPVWYQSPQTVDASFGPQINAIELPAALLQPPFFDPCADPLIDQYDAFPPVGGIHVNGRQTLGENTGDLTGASVARRDYDLHWGDHTNGGATVPGGNTGDQRFLLS